MCKVKYKWNECLQITSFPERGKEAAWYYAIFVILHQWNVEQLSHQGHGVIQWDHTLISVCPWRKPELSQIRKAFEVTHEVFALKWFLMLFNVPEASGEPSYCFYLNKLLRTLFFARLHKMLFTWWDVVIFSVPYVCGEEKKSLASL